MIGWYVHHHGSGHLHRMQAVARQLSTPVTVLSSLDPPPEHAGEWVHLPRDDEGPHAGDVEAHGTLHWVPRHDPGLAARTARIAQWCHRARPELLVVDVSVEVAALARLCGVPTVVVAMPGDRSDRAHTLAYDQAEALLAPWPDGLASTWPERWEEKTTYAGAIGRFDDRVARPVEPRVPGTGLVLWGRGGGSPVDVEELLRATPGRRWTVASPERPLGTEEVWAALCRSEVVLTHAGQNAVAEVAAARTPAVVVADERPFGEQHHTVRRLAALGLAVTAEAWPSPEHWPGLVESTIAGGGEDWKTWNDGRGAVRAAATVEQVARRCRAAR